MAFALPQNLCGLPKLTQQRPYCPCVQEGWPQKPPSTPAALNLGSEHKQRSWDCFGVWVCFNFSKVMPLQIPPKICSRSLSDLRRCSYPLMVETERGCAYVCYVRVRVYIQIYTYMHACIRTYVRTYIHTHMYMYNFVCIHMPACVLPLLMLKFLHCMTLAYHKHPNSPGRRHVESCSTFSATCFLKPRSGQGGDSKPQTQCRTRTLGPPCWQLSL